MLFVQVTDGLAGAADTDSRLGVVAGSAPLMVAISDASELLPRRRVPGPAVRLSRLDHAGAPVTR